MRSNTDRESNGRRSRHRRTGQSGGYRHLFGPVPSRRLGLSLGVDLVSHKTCTFDCVYCESGATTRLTMERDEYVPVASIRSELEAFLGASPRLDFITFSGSGEPTLHSRIDEIIAFLKTAYPQYRIAILTNGSLLFQPGVRAGILNADVVKISLDAATKDIYARINRPCPGIELAHLTEGLTAFREAFHGQLWVELFLVPGLNDGQEELLKIRERLSPIGPDRIQLNTLDRPGTENWVRAVEGEPMEKIASLFRNAEIISRPQAAASSRACDGSLFERILSTIRRRPCTAEDIASFLGIGVDEVSRHLRSYVENGRVQKKEMPRGTFYVAGE